MLQTATAPRPRLAPSLLLNAVEPLDISKADCKGFAEPTAIEGPPSPPPEKTIAAELRASPQTLQSSSGAETIAVIGVGYVGTQLVEAFSKVYPVIAYDVSKARIAQLQEQFCDQHVKCTSDANELAQARHFLISVPTLLKHDKTIDTSYLESAVATVAKYARPGGTVVVESSVAVGMTRKLVGPLAATKGLYVGMSPERVDPGRSFPAFQEIPKVISAMSAPALDAIQSLYGRVFQSLMPVTSPEAAEMTKLYENCQRMVCAAYTNEMADACVEHGLDAWEICRAAATKPFGYQPFTPSAGVGGHCIPVNPYYLLSTCDMPVLRHATERSWQRPADLADRLMRALLKGPGCRAPSSRSQKWPRVLVVGVGFKRGQSVLSHSPGVAIIKQLLNEWDAEVLFADPLVDEEQIPFAPRFDDAADWNKGKLEGFDGIIMSNNQPGLDVRVLQGLSRPLVMDYTGALLLL